MGLKNKNNKPPSKSTYYYIFSNEFYSGYFYWRDKDGNTIKIKGKHKAIISPGDFQRVRYILNGRTLPTTKERKYNFPYRGIIHCGECGCTVTPDHKHQAICTKCKHKFSIKSINSCPICNTSLLEMNNPSIIDKLYYRCSKSKGKCIEGSIIKEEIDKTIEQSLLMININSEMYNWAIDTLKNDKFKLDEDKKE